MAFKYRSGTVAALSPQDRVLKKPARVHGADGSRHRRKRFIVLARSISGQQLCVKAS